ncbi:MAG: 23S rRNA (uracil(1939)-C(5))-methyltransferase RlmD [Clostridia bacterium]|nr:23S rRNA (uracil(1939)-C(5))-methyltransferase RlmD [Clostridia bacterium]
MNQTRKEARFVYNCKYSKKCGGCSLLNLEYEEQLSLKQARLIRLLGRYCRVDEIIGMENPLYYRNKVQSAFCHRNGTVVSGVYQSSTRRIVPIDSCLLEDKKAAEIIKTLKKLAVSFKLMPYDIIKGRGFLRHALVRRGFKSGEIMVVIVTAKGAFPSKDAFVSELIRLHPEITSVVWNVNNTETPLFLGEKETVLFGNGYIIDSLCGLDFRISAKSFYQVNPVQAERLYNIAKEYAAVSKGETVIDAYCGTGTIGLTVANEARSLIGIEVNADAVRDARVNAEQNGIKNARFIAADAGEVMKELAQKGEKIDVVITDPPRAGCSKRFLESLSSLSPERIVYVSCNPETLSRDLYFLKKNGYKVKKIQPVDMFPFTDHVECVVSLTRNNTDRTCALKHQTKGK